MSLPFFELSVPSKTFLLGEYLVLEGGPALILNTEPCFCLKVSLQEPAAHAELLNINLASPAGKFYSDNLTLFNNYIIQFFDPYSGQGGLGASSAQFLMLFIAKKLLEQNRLNFAVETFDWLAMLECYKRYAWDGTGYAPSGADIISQLFGHITYFHKQKNVVKTYSWPFQDLGFVLIRTGAKIATHEHLKNLTSIPLTAELELIVQNAAQALIDKSAELFIQSINDYAQTIQQAGLVAEHTQKMLRQISDSQLVKAAKGCGALGADIVLAVVDMAKLATFTQWLYENNFDVVHKSISSSVIPAQAGIHFSYITELSL